MKDMDGDDACNEADEAGEENKSPVVFDRKAAKNAEHVIRPWLYFTMVTRAGYSTP